MTTDTSEHGLESLIVASLTGRPPRDSSGGWVIHDDTVPYGGAGYIEGDSHDYDRDYAVDLAKLCEFLQQT